MVSPVSSISATSAPSVTKVETSPSITSEPDNAWVALRQSQITADQIAQKRHVENKASNEGSPQGDADAESQRDEEGDREVAMDADEPVPANLSGESNLIGTRNFDDDTPFGERVAIVCAPARANGQAATALVYVVGCDTQSWITPIFVKSSGRFQLSICQFCDPDRHRNLLVDLREVSLRSEAPTHAQTHRYLHSRA